MSAHEAANETVDGNRRDFLYIATGMVGVVGALSAFYHEQLKIDEHVNERFG